MTSYAGASCTLAASTIHGGPGIDTIYGGTGDDEIRGDGEGDTIHGSLGDDQLFGGDGTDTIYGDDGGDRIYGDGGADYLYGDDAVEDNDGDDQIWGGDEGDHIWGGRGSDRLYGLAGGDEIHGQLGDDYIEGGVGEDWLYGDQGDDEIHGNEERDTIDGGFHNDQIYGEQGNDAIRGGAGFDVILGDSGEIEEGVSDYDNVPVVTLSLEYDGNDEIDGGGDRDWIYGQRGTDTLEGGAGDDMIFGGFAVDYIYGEDAAAGDSGIGNDHVEGERAGDWIWGNGGDDVIYGNEEDDRIFGNTNNDRIYGGTEMDTICGGSGNDQIYGEEGADTIWGDDENQTNGSDQDIILGDKGDIKQGIVGPDDIPVVAFYYDQQGHELSGAENDTIHGGGGTDWIYGQRGDDRLYGDAGNDHIFGYDGGDKLWGSAGKDVIYGEAGEDTLYGGADDDALDGGDGTDVVYGDNGPGDLAPPQAQGTTRSGVQNDDDEDGYNNVVYGTNIPAGYDLDWNDDGTAKGSQTADNAAPGNDAIYVRDGSDFVDGQNGDDTYLIYFRGNGADLRINVYDSGSDLAECDRLVTTGTVGDDTLLLRASVSETGKLAFVAMLNGNDTVERVNYWNVERLLVASLAGDDHIAVDDVLAETTLEGDAGSDSFQIGQLYRAPRDANANVEAEDVFATIETTVGWLSNGISRPMVVFGGADNDTFTVFHNRAVLSLYGEDGDDSFLIKAFALAGSQEPVRGRTDIEGGAGADLVQYVVNAPVNIHGGDGFDTVILLGTEFGDDFVITRDGVCGAGLNISFTEIEKLTVDGAEGNDRFWVLSTNPDYVTELCGGLGSDTFNMSGDVPPIVSNDLRGHSGLITHSVENTNELDSAAAYEAIKIAGVAVNVYDNDAGSEIIVVQPDEPLAVDENGGVAQYQIMLSRSPDRPVVVQVMAPVLSDSQNMSGRRSFRVSSPEATDTVPDGSSLSFTFTPGHWGPRTVYVEAIDDEAVEGTTSWYINHVVFGEMTLTGGVSEVRGATYEYGHWKTTLAITLDAGAVSQIKPGFVLTTTDGAGPGQQLHILDVRPDNGEVILDGRFQDPVAVGSRFRAEKEITSVRSLPVVVCDDDMAGIVVTGSEGRTEVFEGGSSDRIQVRLARQPVGDVTITLRSENGQLQFGSARSSEYVLTFTTGNWSTAQDVPVSAIDDDIVEGFDHSLIEFRVECGTDPSATRAATEVTEVMSPMGVEYVVLAHEPIAAEGIQVSVNGQERPSSRCVLDSNRITFIDAFGGLEFLPWGTEVSVTYSYHYIGYDNLDVPPTLADIADNDVAQVKISETAGSTDVVEGGQPGDASPWTDTYEVVLTQRPTQSVFVRVTPEISKTSAGRVVRWGRQVQVRSSAPQAVNNESDGTVVLLFTPANWNVPQIVSVAAVDDSVYDDDDTRYFAPPLHSIADIQGPVYIQGMGGQGSILEFVPVMLPGETNLTHCTGEGEFSAGGSAMVVDKESLMNAAVGIDPGIVTPMDIAVHRLTVTVTAGLDEIDQFRQVAAAEDRGDGTVLLAFNAAFDLAGLGQNVSYALTHLSENFFVKEKEQVDYLFVWNDDSPADNTVESRRGLLEDADTDAVRDWIASHYGLPANAVTINAMLDQFGPESLDGKWLHGLGMGPAVRISGTWHAGGIVYGDLEVVEINLGYGKDQFTITDTHSRFDEVAPGQTREYQTWTIVNTGGGDDAITVSLDAVTDTDGPIAVNTQEGNDVVDASGSTRSLILFGSQGDDRIVAGSAGDVVFGDCGRVIYVRDHVLAEGQTAGEIVTLLGTIRTKGESRHIDGVGANTLTDADGGFATADGGLKGLYVSITNGRGYEQRPYLILSNTADTLVLDRNWEIAPLAGGADSEWYPSDPEANASKYRISLVPEDQTDGVVREPRIARSVDPGIGGNDEIDGGAGRDILFGGSGNDEIVSGRGDQRQDVAVGDGGMAEFSIIGGLVEVRTTYPETGGSDSITTDTGADVALGGSGDDTIVAGGSEYEQDTVIGDNGRVTFERSEAFDPGEEYSTVSFNFNAVCEYAQVTGVAGAPGAAAGNWNNLTGGDHTVYGDESGEIVYLDDGRIAPAVQVEWGSNLDSPRPGGAFTAMHDGISPGDNQDLHLFEGYLVAGLTETLGVNIRGLAGHFRSYDVYVYLDAGDCNCDSQTSARRVSDGNTAFYVNDPDGNTFEGTYVQVSSTDPLAPQIGNYVLFSGLTGDSAAIRIDSWGVSSGWSSNRPAITGVQVVGRHHPIDRVETLNPEFGGGDTIATGCGPDLALGGSGNDHVAAFGDAVKGRTDPDVVAGDNARVTVMLDELREIHCTYADVGGDDVVLTGNGEDLVLGGPGSDQIDSGARGPFDNGSVKVISLNFNSSVPEGKVTGVAGAVQAERWNNLAGGSWGTFGDGSNELIYFDNGSIAKGVTVKRPGGLAPLLSGGHDVDSHDQIKNPGTQNERLFEGYLCGSAYAGINLNLAGLSVFGSAYDLYVYVDADDSHGHSPDSVYRISNGITCFYLGDPAGHTFQGEFVEASATQLQDARPGHYVVFRGLTSDTVEIRVDGVRHCPEDDGPNPVINAIQIVGGRDRSRIEIGGDADKDVVLGDSGVAYLFGGRPVDLRATQPRTGGHDTVCSGDDTDLAIGGAGADEIVG